MFDGEVDSVCVQPSGTGKGLCHDALNILKPGVAAREYGTGIKGLPFCSVGLRRGRLGQAGVSFWQTGVDGPHCPINQ